MSTIFGRDLELSAFERRLKQNSGGRVGYYGAAGIGKTELLNAWRGCRASW